MNMKLFVPRLVWSHNNSTELWTLLNITFWPKTKLRTCQTSQKTEQFTNIKLFVPRLVWSHNNRTELWTLPNITFWPKTKLRTYQTSQKTKLFVPRLVLMLTELRYVQLAHTLEEALVDLFVEITRMWFCHFFYLNVFFSHKTL